MRLKEFIIFIIIFTIIYFAGFAIYDHFKNKKDMENTEKNNYSLLDINKLIKFAKFYNVNITIDSNLLASFYEEIKNTVNTQLSLLANKYNISIDELIVIILFIEYNGLIKTKSINKLKDTISNINDREDTLIVKYSLLFSNKFDYKTLLINAGFGANKEVDYLMEHYLIPGVKIDNSTIYYVGDLDE